MNICNNKYDQLDYTTHDNIKIYSGTTPYSRNQLNNTINYYKGLTTSNNKIFTELLPSTLTAKGIFTNISFNEEDIIDMLTVPSGGYILTIGCNFGSVVNTNPDYEYPPPKARLSNRGRKPKIKPKSKRKLQGSGKYFSSQITFEIYNHINKKIYKIKLFRNGGFQVPGVNKPDMSDLIVPMIILRDYLREEFMDDAIEIQYFISVMRNYICRILDPCILIRLNEFEILLKSNKEIANTGPIIQLIDKIHLKYNISSVDIIKKYVGLKNNDMCVAEIQNNCERYFGLILKFYRPMPWKVNKRTTIKVLRSGKINIDGGNSIDECYSLYHWIEHILNENKSTMLYNPMENFNTEYKYDSGSGESIYDTE